MSWRLFGVKTAYRFDARGRARNTDSSYDPLTTLVEERVVLIRARSLDEAIRKAKTEARRYVRTLGSYRNVYGERVRSRCPGAFNACELFFEPAVGSEVFSANRLFPRRASDRAVIDEIIGRRETQRASVRWRFLHHSVTPEFIALLKSPWKVSVDL